MSGAEGGERDSWVVVEVDDVKTKPEKEEASDSEQKASPEPEPKPESDAAPAEEPAPETRQEAEEPESKAEPEPEKPESAAQPEPVAAAAEPECEPKADEEETAESEPKPEEDSGTKDTPADEKEESAEAKIKLTEDAPSEDKPAKDKPEERASEEDKDKTPTEDKPLEDKPSEDESAEDKPSEDEPAEDKPSEDKPAEDKPSEDKPAEDKPSEDKSAEGTAEEDKAAVEPPNKAATPPPEPGVEIHVGEHLRLLKAGTDLIKVKKTKGLRRVFRLEDDLLAVAWKSQHKKPIKARIPIASIQEVREGKATDTFKGITTSTSPPDEYCFSIIYTVGNKFKNLDLATYTESDRKAWVEGLRSLLLAKSPSGASSSVVRSRWLRDLFEGADKDSSGTLTMKEVLALMNELNVGVSKKILKKMFQTVDVEGEGQTDGKLDFGEFCALFNELSERKELASLFSLYSSKYEWLTVHDLQHFLKIEQGAENPTLELCAQLVQKYEPTDEGKAQGFMSLDGFTQFMLGPESDIFSVDHREVYQDMSQPLSHYFIASSHNTYLLEDQLKGPSSCEAYIRALRKGCRCVELDCWDGPDNTPIIYHGHTLTSKILFRDAIEAIKEHAFAVSSYPVILSIENHCSIPQQERMAEIMEEIFGDLLYKAERNNDCPKLPSPKDLMRKILIKGKKLKKNLEEDDDGEVSDEDEAAEMGDENKIAHEEPKKEPVAKEPAKAESETEPAKTEEPPKDEAPKGEEPPKAEGEEPPKVEGEEPPKVEGEEPPKAEGEEPPKAEGEQPKAEGEQPPNENGKVAKEGKTPVAEGGTTEEPKAEATLTVPGPAKKQRSLSFRSKNRKQPAPPSPKKKIKLSSKLSKLINYVQSVHFTGFDFDAPCYHMSSFSESTANKLSSGSAAKYVAYNCRQISRTYPAGKRVDSSNYDPIPMWNAGCQIVALNYQTPGKAMDLNDGKFQQNGGCGYILKPAIMRDELSRYDPTRPQHNVPGANPQVITIKVISGQNLPKPGGSKEIIDPYVVIEMFGAHEDKKVFKTKVVQDNGFNPQWKESFQMVVNFPELAVLRFKVMDKDLNADDFIGSYSLPLTSVVPGNRHVHLTNAGNKLQNASIFVHVQIQDFVASSRPVKVKSTLKLKKNRDYPEHHLVGFPAIDEKFRDIGTSLRKAVDLQEDYISALLQFREACGYEGQVGVADCIEKMCARAKENANTVILKFVPEGMVYHVTATSPEGKNDPIPQTLLHMVESFNVLNQSIQPLMDQAVTLAEQLEGIRQTGLEKKSDLKQHIADVGPALNYRKTEQVYDNYYKTMYTLKTVANEVRAVKEKAEEVLKKCPVAIQSAGFVVASTEL